MNKESNPVWGSFAIMTVVGAASRIRKWFMAFRRLDIAIASAFSCIRVHKSKSPSAKMPHKRPQDRRTQEHPTQH